MKRGIICFGMMFLSMVIIFMLSHQSGAGSIALTERIASILDIEKMAGYKNLSTRPLFLGLSLRSYGHAVLYAGFGVVVFLFCGGLTKKQHTRILLSILICLIFSLLDEFHQTFVPGRDCELKDLIMDAVGYLSTILICAFAHGLRYLQFYMNKREQPVS